MTHDEDPNQQPPQNSEDGWNWDQGVPGQGPLNPIAPDIFERPNLGGGMPGPEDPRNGPAWEWREQLGTLRALWLTVKEVLTSPSESFSLMRREGGIGAPMMFFYIMQVMVLAVNFITGLFFRGSANQFIESFLRYLDIPEEEIAKTMAQADSSVVVDFVMAVGLGPVFAIFGLLICAVIVHLVLLAVQGGDEGVETTLRTCFYACGACAAVRMIPFCGVLIEQLILVPIILIIGLTHAQECKTWKAVAAVTVPGLLLITCCCVFGGMLMAILAQADPEFLNQFVAQP